MTAPKKKDPPESDPMGILPGVAGSVLLSDQIEFYCDRNNLNPPLIENFGSENLKPARYNLRLGDEAHIEGQWVRIDDGHPLILQPHQVAVVKTYEEINLPRFLIGRWNLRVDMVYEGLLWVGALQVDPGWQGSLPCPIYNLANRTVEIRYKEKVFSIDFVRTTPYQNKKTDDYPYASLPYRPIGDFSVDDYDKFQLHSAVSATVEKVESLSRTVFTFITAGVPGFAILFAALGVLSTSSIRAESTAGSTLLSTVVPISVIAFVAALFSLVVSSYAVSREGYPLQVRSRWVYRLIGFIGVSSLTWGFYAFIAPEATWLANRTAEWILNIPSFYSSIHALVGLFLTIVYWLLTRRR